VLDAQTRTMIGANNLALDDSYNGDTLKQIYDLQLPRYMSWDYWVTINQWLAYWVNRNEIECEDDKVKAAFKLALKMGKGFGTCAVYKKDEEYVIGTLTEIEYKNGEISKGVLIPTIYSNRYGYAEVSQETKLVNWSDKAKSNGIKVSAEDCILFVPRDNGIGDFVWCMKDILIEIYLKTMISSNASNLHDKMYAEVNNPNTLAMELYINRNPFLPYGIKIVDTQSGAGTNEYKFTQSSGGEHSYISTLIETLKHHQEYYYSKYGRPISSNKSQALSSDSSLSISSAEAIANDFDDRVEMFAKDWNDKFGTNIKIVKPELDTPPQNQNADKGGLGQALTEGDKVAQEAKVGK